MPAHHLLHLLHLVCISCASPPVPRICFWPGSLKCSPSSNETRGCEECHHSSSFMHLLFEKVRRGGLKVSMDEYKCVHFRFATAHDSGHGYEAGRKKNC